MKFKLILALILITAISACSSNKNIYTPNYSRLNKNILSASENTAASQVASFTNVCINLYSKTGSIDKLVNTGQLKLLAVNDSYKYVGNNIGLAFTDGNNVFTTTRSECRIFIEYTNSLDLHNEILKSLVSDDLTKEMMDMLRHNQSKLKEQVLLNTKEYLTYKNFKISKEHTTKSRITTQKITAIIAERSSQELLSAVIKINKSNNKYSLYTNQAYTQAILTASFPEIVKK